MNDRNPPAIEARSAVRFRRSGERYVAETRRTGRDLLREPLLNKGSAFSAEERRRLRLEGLLPATPKSADEQAERVLRILRSHAAPIDRYCELAALQDRNEHLFYRVLRGHLEEFMPIVYTPTVGEAVQRYSALVRRSRGLWITPAHRGRMREVLGNLGRDEVRLIVATDNESILGIGDQGAGGIAIAVGKLALYCAAAGLHPALTLPVSLDFGTDNEALLHSPDYVGWPKRRVRGTEYLELVDEFVAAVREVHPGAVLQWEDLRNETALKVLDRHAASLPSFNDDIQGTGATAVAGVISAARLSGVPLQAQRFVVFGAGAAGLGIARQLRTLLAEAERAGGRAPAARRLARQPRADRRGRRQRTGLQAGAGAAAGCATRIGLAHGASLGAVVERYAPHGLVGTSGVPHAFTEPVIRMLAGQHARPLVLPMSNPTTLCEAQPADVIRWSDGRAIVATGSPFGPVRHGGREYRIGQGNNVFVFPGLGLGAIATRAPRITAAMLKAAAAAVAANVTAEDLEHGLIYPPIERLPAVTAAVAQAVAAAAGTPAAADADARWQPTRGPPTTRRSSSPTRTHDGCVRGPGRRPARAAARGPPRSCSARTRCCRRGCGSAKRPPRSSAALPAPPRDPRAARRRRSRSRSRCGAQPPH
ncbi:MAG: oxaloacetate-decarboxylating malate dehydrogenase [Steroidobacteraceae bacterium]